MIADSFVGWGVAAAPDIAHLFAGDNPADDRMSPSYRLRQSKLPCRRAAPMSDQPVHWERRIELELRANGAHNHPLWFSPLNNEPANHHVVARLHKAARANVA